MTKSLFGNPQQELFAQVNVTSLDITDQRIAALKQLFPAVVTDGKIDWNILKIMLGESLEKESERYRFTWNGKNAAIMEAQTVSSKTLIPDIESSKNWNNTENLYIEGDNLEVLKLLQNSYNGKIKMIYIDPPYNTGNDFIYEDDFVLSQEENEENEGIKDKKGTIRTLDRLQKNDKGSAKYHTNWLNMMYPRLSLARDLLTEDGVIFISIDDNEVHNLRKMCDEIFGENNFIGNIIRSTGTTTGQGTENLGKSYDSVIVYSKTNDFLMGGLPLTEKDEKRYNLEDEKGKFSILQLRRTGGEDRREDRPSMYYAIKSPDGKDIFPIGPTGYESRWRVGIDKYFEMEKNNLIYWKKLENGDWGVYFKYYLEGRDKRPANLWVDIEGNKKATRDLKELIGEKIFETPKPLELIERILMLSTEKNSLILDFFSGSATTAHAAMKLNSLDKGNRKYIMVQLPERIEEKSEAYKAGYKNICEIGKERIRRAGEKILSENPEASIDAGFKVFKVETSNIKEWDTEYESVESSMHMALSGTLSMFEEGRSPLDIVYELILKERLPLTATVSSEDINGSKLFNINEGMMYIYLGELNDDVVRRIIELKNESFDSNPKVILDESKLTTEMKSNAKKTFDSNGIKDVKTI